MVDRQSKDLIKLHDGETPYLRRILFGSILIGAFLILLLSNSYGQQVRVPSNGTANLNATISYSPPPLFSNSVNPLSAGIDPSLTLTNSYYVITFYYQGGAGSLSGSAQSLSHVPVTPQVLKYNTQNAAWLITCPQKPNVSNSSVFFTINPTYYIGGDACLTGFSPLSSVIHLNINVNNLYNPTRVMTSLINAPTISNPAAATLTNLGYSGEANGTNSFIFNVSNGYNTQSYIFKNVPSAPQQGIWSWHVRYVNLSDSYIKTENNLYQSKYTYTFYDVPITQAFASIQLRLQNSNTALFCIPIHLAVVTFYICFWFWGCLYNYNYHVNASLNYIANANVPIPNQNNVGTYSPTDYLDMNGYIYTPFTPIPSTSGGALSCAHAMYDGVIQDTPGCSSFKSPVSSTAVLHYSGDVNGGIENNEYVYNNPKNSNTLLVAYKSAGSSLSYPFGQWEEGYVPVPQHSLTTNVPIVPYLLYNISLPTRGSDITPTNNIQFLNLSFDLYSPHNYMNPTSFLDPITLDTGSAFFATTTSSGTPELGRYPSDISSTPDPQALTALQTTFLTSLTSQEASDFAAHTATTTPFPIRGITPPIPGSVALPNGFQTLQGQYLSGTIYNPTFITSAPNDYVYVLNESSTCGLLCFNSNSKTNLFVLRFIPSGYYNLSNFQPDTANNGPAGVVNLQEWNSNWNSYWSNTIIQQSSNLYITGIYQLSNVASSWWHLSKSTGGSPIAANFAPRYMTTDYNNDVFVFGYVPQSGFDIFSSPTLEIAVILGSSHQVVSGEISVPSQYRPVKDLAVSPNGNLLYLASPDSGNVLIYSFTVSGTTAVFTLVKVLSLSYSNSTENFNIAEYLANGGPYGSSKISSAYSSAKSEYDSANYHHPLALFDSKGILYVLDNWTFPDPSCGSSSTQCSSSILMLRAFTINFNEVPISGSSKSDITINSNAIITTPPKDILNFKYPPYGWPLSANISLPSSKLDTYCAADCNHIPPLSYGYQPIGPEMSSTGLISPSGKQEFGMYMGFNGTFYMLAHSYNWFCPTSTYCSPSSQLYTELLAFKFNIQNYSKISYGSNSPYVCYISTNSMKSPCNESIASNPSALNDMQTPLLGVPSSFTYSENQGSPFVGLNVNTALASLVPGGINQAQLSSGTANPSPSQENTIMANGVSSFSNTYNSVVANPSAFFGLSANSLYPTYIDSQISGYFLVPFTSNYALTQKWYPQPTKKGTLIFDRAPSNVNDKGCPPYYLPIGSRGPSVIFVYPFVTYSSFSAADGGPPNQAPYCTSKFQQPSSSGSNNYANDIENCTVYTSAISSTTISQNAKSSIEGGPTYLQYFVNKLLYQPNLSDANLIIPPVINMTAFTNRVFGEVYVNRTIASSGTLSTPVVINASHLLDYRLITVLQYPYYAFLGGYPGYAVEQTEPVTPPSLGVNPGGVASSSGGGLSSGIPGIGTIINTGSLTSSLSPGSAISGLTSGNYYYNPSSALNEPSVFNYTNTSQILQEPLQTGPLLYNEYSRVVYLDSIFLQLNNTPHILGYNRLIFTYVDRFNNTIYMPVDVDFANMTTIQLNTTASVDVTNPNDTTITVNGVAGTYNSQFSSTLNPLPANSKIYIYYDTNLNFYNSTVSPPSSKYYQYAQRCAFAANVINCPVADPLSTLTQAVNGVTEANAVTFHTQYQSGTTCAPEPKSMLNVPNYYQCSIFGANSLPETRSLPSDPSVTEYCMPIFSNGIGIFTSQLGMVNVVNTNGAGDFNYAFNVCGTGEAKISATYYGWPPPEPQQFSQSPLSSSVASSSSPGSSSIISTGTSQISSGISSKISSTASNLVNKVSSSIPSSISSSISSPISSPTSSSSGNFEYNYTDSSGTASQSVSIGLYALKFGDVGALGVVLIVLALLAFSLFSSRSKRD